MLNKTIAILAAVILVASIAVISSNASAFDTSKPGLKGDCPFKSGAGFESSMEDKMSLMIEKLGLPEDATMEDVKAAMKEKIAATKEEWMSAVREKLGLPEDASLEDVKAALQEWKEENKDLAGGFKMHKKTCMHW